MHPSIIRIQSITKYTDRFSFSEVSIQQVASQLARLDPKKSSPVGAIPAKILKEHPDIFAHNLCNLFNQSVAHSTFPLELKAGEITSLFKKDDAFLKKNFRPITVLPAVSKVFERLIHSQLMQFADSFLSILLCGFPRGFSTQNALLRFLEKVKMGLDNKNLRVQF